MKCYEISKSFTSSGFEFGRGFSSFDFEREYSFEDANGTSLEAFEDRADIDGTPRPRYPLTEDAGSFICTEDLTSSIREQLGRNGAKLAEFTITTQFDTYRGFRAYNLHEEAPDAPVFRLLNSPADPTPFWIQLYTEQFVTWLRDKCDNRGLIFEEIDTDDRYYQPSN